MASRKEERIPWIGVWEADFDYLIDIQRKNLENPSLFENFDEVFTKIMEADLK